jgi:phosphoribosyl-dephospho-CoA transferase
MLPVVASTMVSPGEIRPSSSALSIMYLAMRALIEPEGFKNSHLQ